jgi:HEAT repeat protein
MTLSAARLRSVFQIRPGEFGLVVLLTSLMLVANAGGAVSSPGIEALFYTRFGVQFLPVMYIILGLVSPMTSIIMSGVLTRLPGYRLYVAMPLVMAFLLICSRLVLILNLRWFYAVLWLGMNVFWILKSLFTWGLAGLTCDTRQAKRLFPLFGVGGIVGLALGSFLTPPLVNLIGTENLVLVWPLSLLLASILGQRLVVTFNLRASAGISTKRRVSLIGDFKQGFRYVRSSPLLRWMSLAAVIFAILYYSLVFPFARAVNAEFPGEDAVAAFLGGFQGIATGVAVIASLFFANRLYARFGFMTIILVYPIIYLLGFSFVAVTASFTAIVLFRFVQVFWSEGVFQGANQAMFNVVPPERRESSRAFIVGIANQLGVFLAGVLLLLGDRILPAGSVFIIGTAAAALTIYFVWQARRAYGPAVVAALRAGQSQIFFSEEEPFGGFQQDAKAVSTAVDGIHSQEVTVRRVAADILGRLSVPVATNAIVEALDDSDASVRVALVQALGTAGATSAMLEVTALLQDPVPEVRLQAIRTLSQLTDFPRGIRTIIEPLLADPDPAVRCRAAATLLRTGPHPEAEGILLEMARADGRSDDEISERILALKALSESGSQDAYPIAADGLNDPSPAIRRVSAKLVAQIDPQKCLIPLQKALGDENELVRQAAAEALGQIGEPALEPVLASLLNPQLEEGALLALQYLTTRQATAVIKEYADQQVGKALHYYDLWRNCQGYMAGQQKATAGDNGQLQRPIFDGGVILADSLIYNARYHGTNALQAIAAIGNKEAINLAVENLNSQVAGQRANAMETLDSIGDRDVVRRVMPLWERADADMLPADTQWLEKALRDVDPWIRSCSAFMAKSISENSLKPLLEEMAEEDPDPLVRESAQSEAKGESNMDTIDTLSTMERVLFLHRVPLFANLPPNDLKQIAMIADESTFSDGAIIAEQGEAGDVLYIIVSGEILVTAADDNGHQIELGRRQPGEYVGEMAIISDEVRMASLTALGEVRTLCINQSQFREIIRLRPEASLAVMSVLCERLRELS